MTTELNEMELESVVGGARYADDGKRYNVYCTKGSGDKMMKYDQKKMKGTAVKDSFVARVKGQGYTCTVTEV